MTPVKIIIHHSASEDSEANNTAGIRAYHKSLGWKDCGYHGIIEKVGSTYEVIMGREWDKTGAHTIGQNDKSFGLCLVGNFSLAAPPADQLAVAAKFCRFLMRMYGLTMWATGEDRVIHRHAEFNSTECPGTLFPWAEFVEMVKEGI
jgi:hypothetical protein